MKPYANTSDQCGTASQIPSYNGGVGPSVTVEHIWADHDSNYPHFISSLSALFPSSFTTSTGKKGNGQLNSYSISLAKM